MKYLLSIIIAIGLSTNTQAQSILFAGNSLTYSNDLPGMVKTIGKSLGKKLKTQCICLPNYGLEDHWNDGLLQKKLAEKAFDYIIFQQGPSSQAYGRESLYDYGRKITQKAKKHNTRAAYLMVWPSLQYYQTFDGVIKNHTDAARENEALLIPAGQVWRSFRETENSIDLYSFDGFHPSPEGTFLVALMIIKTLFPKADISALRYKRQYMIQKESFAQLVAFAGKK